MDTTQKYWAGGHNWSSGSRLAEFLANNEWYFGYEEADSREKAERCRELFAQIQIDDEFAIKGAPVGRVKIYYIGRVQEIDLQHNRLKLNPLRREQFEVPAPRGKNAGNWQNTLLQVTRPDVIDLIFHRNEADVEPPKPPLPVPAPVTPKSFPLNQILYGPPGTGKTYSTIRRAVEIVEGTAPEAHVACKAHFDALVNAGRIAFVTFHQSFAYEDFIEGIRPALEGEGEARYELRDGILKEIALRAFGACLEATRPGEATFQDVWGAFVERAENDAEWRLPGLGTSKYKIWFTSGGDVMGDNIAGRAKGIYCAPRQKIEMLWDKLRDSPKIATREMILEVIRKGSHVHFLSAILEELKRLKPHAGSPSTDAPSREAIVTFLCGGDEYRLKLTPAPRFVLIVDEINRGNIAKILGELITLLEDDKRLPGDNSLRVKLPYSGEMFALPSNLHILGTMNTADKSLALVDVALRRRFEFEELAPDWSVCPELTPAMREALRELNRRITLRKDREHRIGHAYFVNLSSKGGFDKVFRRHVIPLLQEYFFNDWDGLRFVLGEKGASGNLIVALPGSEQREARNRWAWWFDENSEAGECLAWLIANYAAEESDGA